MKYEFTVVTDYGDFEVLLPVDDIKDYLGNLPNHGTIYQYGEELEDIYYIDELNDLLLKFEGMPEDKKDKVEAILEGFEGQTIDRAIKEMDEYDFYPMEKEEFLEKHSAINPERIVETSWGIIIHK